MPKLGTEERPVIVKTNSQRKIDKITAVCDFYELKFIVGIEIDEDLTDLKRAVKNKLEPFNPYSECIILHLF
ncbi:DNA-binding protein [Virgibacillus doumboii]|uniref:DNA-binding protein n=1 Tax=Virgibacillus doumboii TaxID=2697503 RepID=UPI0013DF5D0A|nr:DNA-binding protein [Virgibacillus doumboii]